MYKQKKVLNPETIRLTKKEKSGKSRLVLWAELMKSVFTEDVCVCRNCGGRMQLRAVLIRLPYDLHYHLPFNSLKLFPKMGNIPAQN